MQQHVGILLLRRLGAVALRVGIGRNVKRIGMQHAAHVRLNVGRECRIDLVQYILAIEQRPHLADGFIPHPRHDAADVIEHGVGGTALVPPVRLRARQLVGDRMALAAILVGQYFACRLLMLHVIDVRADFDQRLEGRMSRHVLDAFTINIDLASVAQ